MALFLSKTCSPKTRLSSPPCSNTCLLPCRASQGHLDRAATTGRQKRESTPRQLGATSSLYIQREPKRRYQTVTKNTRRLLDTRRALCQSENTAGKAARDRERNEEVRTTARNRIRNLRNQIKMESNPRKIHSATNRRSKARGHFCLCLDYGLEQELGLGK